MPKGNRNREKIRRQLRDENVAKQVEGLQINLIQSFKDFLQMQKIDVDTHNVVAGCKPCSKYYTSISAYISHRQSNQHQARAWYYPKFTERENDHYRITINSICGWQRNNPDRWKREFPNDIVDRLTKETAQSSIIDDTSDHDLIIKCSHKKHLQNVYLCEVEFKMCHAQTITLRSMRSILPELLSRSPSNMKEAFIGEFDEPCDEDFEKFLSHYSDLEALSMEGRCLFNDDYLKLIGGKLRRLRSVVITMNTSITDTGLRYLSGENDLSEEVSCPLLENLDIKKASGITDAGILSITSRLQQLRHLALWINEVNQNVVQRIAGMQSLKSVILRNDDEFFMTQHEQLMQQAGFVKQYRAKIDGDSANGFEEHWIKNNN